MNNEESKISIGPKIEKIKGTMQLAKIKEALDLQYTVVHDRRPKIKVRGKPIWIILTKFVVQYS